MIQLALDWIARGFSIIPMYAPTPAGCSCLSPTCHSPGKHPAAPWGWVDAPDIRESEARIIWSRMPGAGVGLRMGRGHVAVQVFDHGADDSSTYPPTLTWRSENSVFFIFQGEGRGCRVRPGVEFRGKGSIVLTPRTMLAGVAAPCPGWWHL